MASVTEKSAPGAPTGVLSAPRVIALKSVEDQRQFKPHIYWYLSFRCNLSCKHCSVFSSPSVDTSTDLSTADCMRVVHQMADLNVEFAILTGGEVLLRPDALQIISALAERDIAVGLETNGLRFDAAFVKLARELQARRRLQITVSLDGGTQDTHDILRGNGSFRGTTRGLRFIRDEGVQFHIQCVLNRANYHTIPNIYDLATELSPGLVMVQFAFLNSVGRGVELSKELGLRSSDLSNIFESIKVNKVRYAGQTLVKGPPAMIPPQHLSMVFQDESVRKSVSCQFPLLGVLPNGDVTICAVSRNNDDLRFGNICELSLADVWRKTRMDMLRSRYVAANDLNGICGDCIWKYKCKGGCRAWAYEDGGDFDAASPICRSMHAAGEFPKVYQISEQNNSMMRKLGLPGGDIGCSCH